VAGRAASVSATGEQPQKRVPATGPATGRLRRYLMALCRKTTDGCILNGQIARKINKCSQVNGLTSSFLLSRMNAMIPSDN